VTAAATVLVADDHASNRDNIARALRAVGLDPVFAADGVRALSTLREGSPDIAVIDADLPRTDGVAVCRALRAEPIARYVPIVLVTSAWDAGERATALRAGADAIFDRASDVDELVACVQALLRLRTALGGGAAGVADAPGDDVGRDPLTGLWSAGHLEERLDAEVLRATRHNEPLSLVVLELDERAELARKRGAGAADLALIAAAEALTRCTRGTDIVARCREPAFAIVLPNTHFAGAMATADRIWRGLAGGAVELDGGGRARLSASIGVACFPNREVRNGRDLLAVARRALERARAEGPAHVCLVQHQAYVFQPS
jgi:diguanylate cyclase (GGDEF)-like protein